MPGGSVDRLFASCVYTLACILYAGSCICPVHIEPKAPTPVNKAVGAATPGIWGEMPQPGKLFISVRFGAADSPCRKFLGPWYAAKKRNLDHPEIMTLDVSALEVRGLTKRFDRPAVDALDLTVRSGEFYALLGPNGAGKTTTLRMVAGLLRPVAGTVSILGIDALADPTAAKRIMAWLSDEPMIYDKLTPFEYLEFVAGLWGVDVALAEARARELIDWLGLRPHAHERCEGVSKGMRPKVALARALVHEPKLIILDEPLTGLDAGAARQVKTVLRERVSAGSTVIMTTHILEVAERMADRIGVIAAGRLIAEGTLDDLRRQTGKSGSSLEDTFLTLVARETVAA